MCSSRSTPKPNTSASSCNQTRRAPPLRLSWHVESEVAMSPSEDPSLQGSKPLRGKTLFITGDSRGIGLAIGLRAAREGANVAIAAKTTEPHPKLPGTIYTAAEEIARAGGQALPLAVDIREEAAVLTAVAKTVERFGGIDVLVNNASAISLTGTLETPMK